jgi:hypothetical protein
LLLASTTAVFLVAARANEVLAGQTLGPIGPAALFVLLLAACCLTSLYVFEDGRFIFAVAGPLSVAVGFLIAMAVLVAVGWMTPSPSIFVDLAVAATTGLILGIAGAAVGNAARSRTGFL